MFLKNEKQLVFAKELQKFHAKTKMRRADQDSLDAAVFLRIKQARAMGTPIGGALIMVKADSLEEKLNIRDFRANHGWQYRFKIRRSLIYKRISGKSASVTPEMTKEWRSNTLPTLLARYSNDDVYNADEKCLLNKTYSLGKGRKLHATVGVQG